MNHEVISTQSYSDLSLAALKKSRKQIEQDAQILANRIALLKQEELKSWKKIEETKKKAREVYLQKKRHEERQQEVTNLLLPSISFPYSNFLEITENPNRKTIEDAIHGAS